MATKTKGTIVTPAGVNGYDALYNSIVDKCCALWRSHSSCYIEDMHYIEEAFEKTVRELGYDCAALPAKIATFKACFYTWQTNAFATGKMDVNALIQSVKSGSNVPASLESSHPIYTILTQQGIPSCEHEDTIDKILRCSPPGLYSGTRLDQAQQAAPAYFGMLDSGKDERPTIRVDTDSAPEVSNPEAQQLIETLYKGIDQCIREFGAHTMTSSDVVRKLTADVKYRCPAEVANSLQDLVSNVDADFGTWTLILKHPDGREEPIEALKAIVRKTVVDYYGKLPAVKKPEPKASNPKARQTILAIWSSVDAAISKVTVDSPLIRLNSEISSQFPEDLHMGMRMELHDALDKIIWDVQGCKTLSVDEITQHYEKFKLKVEQIVIEHYEPSTERQASVPNYAAQINNMLADLNKNFSMDFK